MLFSDKGEAEQIAKDIERDCGEWTYYVVPYGGDEATATQWYIAARDEDGYELGSLSY